MYAPTLAQNAPTHPSTSGPAIPITPEQIDSTVEREMQAFQVPGMAAGIVKDGTLVFAKGYGVREVGKPGRVGDDRQYDQRSDARSRQAPPKGKPRRPNTNGRLPAF
jgi:CubicO group peptidase (beta-lactamase class C family)